METLPKDMVRLLLLSYLGVSEWSACFRAARVFWVLTEEEKQRQYAQVRLQRLGKKLFGSARGQALFRIHAKVAAKGGAMDWSRTKVLCLVCATFVRRTHCKKHVCRFDEDEKQFGSVVCDECGVRIERYCEQHHRRNECLSHACEYCGTAVKGECGTLGHDRFYCRRYTCRFCLQACSGYKGLRRHIEFPERRCLMVAQMLDGKGPNEWQLLWNNEVKRL